MTGTMSAQQRYRTLVHHIGRIYAAPEGTRTELLQTGLDQIVSVVGPTNATAWTVVSADSDRLLKVWAAKEKEVNEPASAAVVEQLADMLRELASAPGTCYEAPAPILCDRPCPDAKPMVLAAVVEAAPKLIVEEVAPVVEAVKPAKPVVEVVAKPPVAAKVEAITHVDEEEYEVEEEEEEEEEEEVVEEEVIEAEEEEEEAVEEEEEGMELEQIMIRGRTWWLESNTQKIYAVIDGDDVGDEMGEMVNGKPRFYTK
jgi:hypothetical protein